MVAKATYLVLVGGVLTIAGASSVVSRSERPEFGTPGSLEVVGLAVLLSYLMMPRMSELVPATVTALTNSARIQ